MKGNFHARFLGGRGRVNRLRLPGATSHVTMSLSVNAYTRRPDGGMEIVSVDSSEELAGFERCRRELWGHEFVRGLGLTLLPTLAEGDIYAEGEAVGRLERDTQCLLTHVTSVAAATRYTTEFITQRCQNILGAISRAREIGGGVVIW